MFPVENPMEDQAAFNSTQLSNENSPPRVSQYICVFIKKTSNKQKNEILKLLFSLRYTSCIYVFLLLSYT
jgi:hypothetical protein